MAVEARCYPQAAKAMSHSTVIAMLSVSLLTTGCVTSLPPPAAPERVAPSLAGRPPSAAPEGSGRVVLDAAGEPARVVEIVGSSTSGIITARGYGVVMTTTTRPLCLTPCIADLSYGSHALAFMSDADPERGSVASVDVGDHTTVMRHAMGRTTRHPALVVSGATAIGVGALGIGAGAILAHDASRGSPWTDKYGNSSRVAGDTSPGYALASLGGALLVTGAILLVLGRTEVQPGASTQWVLTEPKHGPRKDDPLPGQNVVFHN